MPIYIYSSRLTDQEREFLAAELKRLAALPLSELSALPEHGPIAIPEGLKDFCPWAHREVTEDGAVHVVVQGCRDTKRFLFFQFAAVEAEGFVKDKTGKIKRIEASELYDYT